MKVEQPEKSVELPGRVKEQIEAATLRINILDAEVLQLTKAVRGHKLELARLERYKQELEVNTTDGQVTLDAINTSIKEAKKERDDIKNEYRKVVKEVEENKAVVAENEQVITEIKEELDIQREMLKSEKAEVNKKADSAEEERKHLEGIMSSLREIIN